jgi:hypothetical protein
MATCSHCQGFGELQVVVNDIGLETECCPYCHGAGEFAEPSIVGDCLYGVVAIMALVLVAALLFCFFG